MSTIADVCQLAGVSKATVSRVLNGTGQVTESTRQRVYDAVNHLSYRPSRVARALATSKTDSIGLIVPVFEGAYYGALLSQAATSASLAGKQLIITDGHNDPVREKETILMLNDRRCDAIVIYSRSITEEILLELRHRITIPLITINRRFSHPSLPCITFDQSGAAYMMVRHLIHQGHRNIVCIAGDLDTNSGIERLKGYKKALAEFDIPFNPALVESGHNCHLGGYQACQNIIAQPITFTAIFACSDEMALGAQKALQEIGLCVPSDKSIAGFDDSPVARYSTPALTTIKVPIKEMAHSAVQMAIYASEKQLNPASCEFNGELIERASIARI
jgi:DNA-binding LacI/PurR family transcriptional regulator